MDVDKLIEAVREYTFLYDSESKYYTDCDRKLRAWKEIGKALNQSDIQCKRTWSNLRDALRRHMKKQKLALNCDGMPKRKKWKFEDEMAFIIPYIKEREPNKSMNIEETNEDFREDSIEDVIDDIKPNISIAESHTSSSNKVNYFVNPEEESLPSLSSSNKRLTETNTREDTSVVLMKLLLSKVNSGEGNQSDDIDLFFKGITATVKKFSPLNRAIAKSKVFQVISEMEIKMLSDNIKPEDERQSHFAL